jgi:hypothetical protein
MPFISGQGVDGPRDRTEVDQARERGARLRSIAATSRHCNDAS